MNKNIAFVILNINPSSGGTERVTFKVTNELTQIGYKCFYIYGGKDNDTIPTDSKLFLSQKENTDQIFRRISEFITAQNINTLVVVNQSYQTKKWQAIFKQLKRKNGIKIIACLHAAPDYWKKKDSFFLVLPKAYIKSRLKRYLCYIYNRNKIKAKGMYELSDKFLLLSDRYKKTFEQTFHIDDTTHHKIVAIPNPCPFKDQFNNTERKNIVLICARMSEIQKRIFFALKIWKKIYKHTEGWELAIVGDGPDRNVYEYFANTNNLSNVKFYGHRSDVATFYKRAKIFMMTSIWEGQPMSLIEAMHYGCVPIAMDSFESIHDLIVHDQNGILCKYNNLDDFAFQLQNLLKDNERITKFSRFILETENTYFNLESIISKWNHLLTTIQTADVKSH